MEAPAKLDRLERVTDLVLVLLDTSQPLTLDSIAHQVPGYPVEHSARRQAFERDKRLLRDEGLLEFRQGRGIRVSGTPQRGVVLAKAIELVQLGRQSGYNRAELLAIIEALP